MTPPQPMGRSSKQTPSAHESIAPQPPRTMTHYRYHAAAAGVHLQCRTGAPLVRKRRSPAPARCLRHCFVFLETSPNSEATHFEVVATAPVSSLRSTTYPLSVQFLSVDDVAPSCNAPALLRRARYPAPSPCRRSRSTSTRSSPRAGFRFRSRWRRGSPR